MAKIRSLFTLALFALSANVAGAQQTQRRITGRVTAEGSGEPITSAQVAITGTSFSTTTTDDGSFSITAPIGDVRMIVRRIGYTRRDIPVAAGTSEVNVQLVRDVLQLETQVVTGAATTQSSQNAANAVTVLSTDQINRAPQPTLDNALQGKVPGATITQNSGAPGGGTQIQLRGVTSINASSSPLYVVDGVIMNNAATSNGLNAISGAAGGNLSSNQDQQVNRIADINPADIETIEVLKGAASGAIYGSKGSNGVIIITTKRGTTGKPVVSFTQRLGTQAISNTLGSKRYTLAEALDNGYGTFLDKKTSTTADTAAITQFVTDNYNSCNGYCDNEKMLYDRKALSYETDASVRGGTTSGTNYFVAGTARRDEGIQVNTGYSKQSFRANLGQAIGSKLTLRANSELLHTLTERGLGGNDNNNVSPYTNIAFTPSYFDQRPKNGAYPSNPFLAPSFSNLYQDADLIRSPENVYRLVGSVAGDYSIFTNERNTLTASLLGGIDAYSLAGKIYSPPSLYFDINDDGLAGTVVNTQGNFQNANLNGSLVHRYTSRPFTATTSTGFRQERREAQQQTTTGRGLPLGGVTDVGTALQTFVNEFQQTNKDFSYFVQEELLTLNERLSLTAAINSERSSVNGDPNKFFSYPKFSAAYNVPGLPSFADNVKFRIAYGRAGNLPPYSNNQTFLTATVNDNVTGYRPSTIRGLADIHPERSTELEGGFDLAFFANRVGLNFTEYRKQVDDLILSSTPAASTGFSSVIIQSGNQLVNNGTEVGLNLNPVRSHAFSWTSNTTFFRNSGEVTKLSVPAFAPPGAFATNYGQGRVQQGKSPTQVYTQLGCSAPLSSSGACAAANKILGTYGDYMPDFQMGFANDFDIGIFHLGSLFDWRKGGKVSNLTNNYFDGAGSAADQEESATRFAAYRAGLPVYVENGTFVKLREVSASVGLPQRYVGSIFRGLAKDARFEVTGRNLFTWTKYTGLDPEVSNFGNANIRQNQDVTPFPPSRQYFFSIVTSF